MELTGPSHYEYINDTLKTISRAGRLKFGDDCKGIEAKFDPKATNG